MKNINYRGQEYQIMPISEEVYEYYISNFSNAKNDNIEVVEAKLNKGIILGELVITQDRGNIRTYAFGKLMIQVANNSIIYINKVNGVFGWNCNFKVEDEIELNKIMGIS